MATRKGMKNISKLIDMARDELPVSEAFLNSLTRSMEMDAIATKRPPSTSYKPSSMHCIRDMYYQRIGKEGDSLPPDYTSIGIWNSGSDIHVRVQTAISKMKDYGFKCEYVDVGKYVKTHKLKDIEVISQQGMETKLFNKKYNLSFLCDGVIKFEGHYYILEIKSEASFKWNNRTAPAEAHHNQVSAYSLSLEIPEVMFVYVNRDNLDMKTYLFKPTDEMKQHIVGMIENCEGYVERHITPPKPEGIDRKTCEWCGYKMVCRKDK